MNDTSILEISANEAREFAQEARKKSYMEAMKRIESFSKMGLNEAPLMGMSLDLLDIDKLIKKGFSVSTFLNPMDQVTFYKVSW